MTTGTIQIRCHCFAMALIKDKYVIGGTLLILILGLFLRTYDLALDPPMDIGAVSQDLATDPYHVTSFAANKATFGQWELFPYPEWQVFKVSLPSLLAYCLFSIGKPNIFWNSLAGVTPAFIGILLIVLALPTDYRRAGRWAAPAAAAFLSFNFALVTYSRAPFLETAVAFYFGVILFLLFKWGTSPRILIIIGIVTALACLTGRPFAVTIALALITALIFSRDKRAPGKAVMLAGAMAVSGIVLLFVLFGDRIGAYADYILERSDTSRGNLLILQGVKDFIVVLFSYGSESRLFRHSPFLFAAGYLSVVCSLLLFRFCYRWFRENFLLRFSLWWLLWMYFFFVPFNYRPLRYSLLLYIPLVLIIAAMIQGREVPQKDCPRRSALLAAALLFYVNFFFLIHLVIDFMYDTRPANRLTLYACLFLPAIGLTIIMSLGFMGRNIQWIIKRLPLVLIALAVCSIIYQGSAYYRWVAHSHRTTEDAATDLAQILGGDAVMAGPYAPRLTLGSKHRNFIYYFGMQRKGENIIDQFAITHLALDQRNLEAATKDFPNIRQAETITEYTVRGRTIFIHRLPIDDSRYRPSQYETAQRFLSQGILDSAYSFNQQFRDSFTNNISGMKQLYGIALRANQIDQGIVVLNQMSRAFPDNVDVQLYCATNYKSLARTANRPGLITLAEKSLSRAKYFYPGFEAHLQRLYDK